MLGYTKRKRNIMNTIFHVESEHLLQVIQELNQRKIKYTRINLLPHAKTPYQNMYIGMDVEIEETEIPKFLRCIQEISLKTIIRLYRKEIWQTKLEAIPYYRPYPIMGTSLLKTTYLYQKLRQGENFQKDFLNVVGNPFPSFLEQIEVTLEKENYIKGLYQSVSHALNSDKVVSEDLGKFEIEAIEKGKNYKLLTKVENYRKQFLSQATLNDYLFETPCKNGTSTYKMLEYYVPYKDDTILHFGEETNKIELYKKEETIDCIPEYTFWKNNITNTLEKEIVAYIESESRRRVLK